jgi:serine/threonine protein kinase
MGEVYRARDTKLNRDVAIKVLRPVAANGSDRLARYSREGRVLASLNHPNIAHIYGIEDVDCVKALVLELVERILAIKEDDSVRSDHIIVVQNWLSEARALLSAPHK